MRSVRIVLGLLAAVCAFSALTGVAAAKEKEKLFFGEFFASRVSGPINAGSPALVKGKGEVSEFRLGPYNLENCSVSAKSNIDFEKSTTYTTTLSFGHCETISTPGGHIEEVKKVHFKLGVEFNANRSAQVGDANRSAQVGEEAGFTIVKGSSVSFKVGSSKCVMSIPQQFLPAKAGTEPNKEYEAAEYETIEEEVEGGKLKTYPSGFKDTLFIFMEFKKIHSDLHVTPLCRYKEHTGGGEEEGKLNEKGEVEYSNGKLEAEFEELELPKGEFGFEPPV
jgi:hypothetical protein